MLIKKGEIMSIQANPLPLRRLGRTELEVTCLGMGGAGTR